MTGENGSQSLFKVSDREQIESVTSFVKNDGAKSDGRDSLLGIKGYNRG